MSADLDPFFTALRRDGDALPPGAPLEARRRGRSRTLRTVAGAAVGVLVLAGGVTVALRGGEERAFPPQPATSPVVTGPIVRFTPLRAVGKPIATPGEARFSTIVTTADRAFVGRQAEGGELTVTAVDVGTGRRVWGPKPVATFGDAAYVVQHPRYVIAIGRHDNGTSPDGLVAVFDRATSTELMRVDVDNFERDHVILGDSLIIIDSRPDRMIRAYDLATGDVRWSRPDEASPVSHLTPVHNSGSLTDVAGHRGQLALGGGYGFTELVQVNDDGTAIVLDAATGAPGLRFPQAASPASGTDHDEILAVDGVLYTRTNSKPSMLRAVPLRAGTARRVIHTSSASGHGMTPCGQGQLCFIEYDESPTPENPALHRIVSVDLATGRIVWQVEYDPRDLTAVGDTVLAATSGRTADADATSALFHRSGQQVLSEEGSKGTARWLDANAMMVLRQGERETTFLGLSPVNGEPVRLGTVADARGCGWNTTHLICVTPKGIEVWRFTG